jgi:AcrR family transcriptional regulator
MKMELASGVLTMSESESPKDEIASGVKPLLLEDDAPANGRKATSRHYQRAHRDRGAETRIRLLDAALDVFGKYGFEGATTRQIARDADANLAAIVYHFGSKEALHRAVAEYIAGRILEKTGELLEEAARPDAAASPDVARAMLRRLTEHHVETLLGTAEAERWARFIVREQMQPTSAFEVIYRIMGNAVGIGSRLIAKALGRPEDDETRLRAFMLFGQVLVFRVAQALVLRRMGWQGIGPKERSEIKRIALVHLDAILDAGGAP